MNTIEGLVATGPAPEMADKLALFGQFVGDWELDAQWFLTNGVTVKGKGEIHFGWILNGTAVQDVWVGRAVDPPAGFPETSFGTTVRVYDPAIDAWRCSWSAPLSGTAQIFLAHQVGDEIVLEDSAEDLVLERWIYSEITPDSFRWTAEESHSWGRTWRLTEEMRVRRVGPSQPSLSE